MFYLAHLSDPHLAPMPKVSIHELANKRAIGYLNWKLNRSKFYQPSLAANLLGQLKRFKIDHYALTGDLVNLGLPQEFVAARKWLQTIAPPDDLSVVPGNHDAYVPGALALARTNWLECLTGDDAYHLNDYQPFPFLRVRKQIAIIGVSCAKATLPFMATGKIGDLQLERLNRLLLIAKQRRLVRIVLLHHPPYPGATSTSNGLDDAKEFCQIIERVGADLILHGHIHKTSLAFINGPQATKVPVAGIASLSGKNRNQVSKPETFDKKAASFSIFKIDYEHYPQLTIDQTVIQNKIYSGKSTVLSYQRTIVPGSVNRFTLVNW